MLPYACFDLLNFRHLTRYEQCMLYKTVFIKGYDFDLFNLHVKILDKHNYLFDLKPKMIKFLAMFYSKININNISNNAVKLKSVISINVRIMNISKYQLPLNEKTLSLFESSTNVGFCIIKKSKIPKSVYNVLVKNWIVNAVNSISLEDACNRLALGEVLLMTDDLFHGQLETYECCSDGQYPSIIEWIDLFKHTGNFLNLRFFGSSTTSKDVTPYYHQLFRRVVVQTFSEQVSRSPDSQLPVAINGTYLVKLYISSVYGVQEHSIVVDIYIDVNDFVVFDLFKAEFDISFRCLNDPHVTSNFANLLFRGHSYDLANKLDLRDATAYSVKLNVVRSVDAFTVECDNPIRNVVNSVLQSAASFITIVGPKGSGKSRFVKDFKSYYEDYYIVDSDVYGSYISYLFRHLLGTSEIVYSENDFSELLSLEIDYVDHSIFVDAMNYAQDLKEDDEQNYFPNVLIKILNGVECDFHNKFMDYVVKLYDHKILGLKKFQDIIRYCATVNQFRHVLMFAHTSLESYFDDVDLELTVNPNFNEFSVIITRSRTYELHLQSTIDIEVALNLIYSRYISKKNSFGWQIIYKLLGIPNYVDLTDCCINFDYKYMKEYTSDELGAYRVYRLPGYFPTMALTRLAFPKLRGAVLLPIGHGKSTATRMNRGFIQIDDVFSNEELVALNSVAHFGSYLYLETVVNFFINNYRKGAYDNKVLLYHDVNIARALGFNIQAMILSNEYIQDILQYSLVNDKFKSMVANVREVLESNVAVTLYDSHDDLFEALVGRYH